MSKVKNGIIIDGILHEPSEGSCSECSLKEPCINNLCDCHCVMLDMDATHECFVNRGKVTEIRTEVIKNETDIINRTDEAFEGSWSKYK